MTTESKLRHIVAESSPRTRGSAPGRPQRYRLGRVFPAHAGIGLFDTSDKEFGRCLPRARGDRPSGELPRIVDGTSSPRTRGSASHRSCSNRSQRVFPAHAGIGLFVPFGTVSPGSLPRARGDRPGPWPVVAHPPWSSPRTRGSAPGRCPAGPALGVFPAHAGIGPSALQGNSDVSCLPRARGDRPRGAIRRRARAQSSPRTRGSARAENRGVGSNTVFPAHAGIGPLGYGFSRRFACLPRARGDRPLSQKELGDIFASSPRTRGSAWQERQAVVIEDVFPAHAGIGLAQV